MSDHRSHGQSLLRTVRILTGNDDSSSRQRRAYHELLKLLQMPQAAGGVEVALFETRGVTQDEKRKLIHFLAALATDEAFAVLGRVVNGDGIDADLKNQAALSMLQMNAQAAWRVIGITGPSWLDPITLVPSGPVEKPNGPGRIGGIIDTLFKEIALGTGEPDYGRQPKEIALDTGEPHSGRQSKE